MKDSVEQFVRDEDFNILPFLMLQGAVKGICTELKKCMLCYGDVVFWIHDNFLCVKKTKEGHDTYYTKSLEDVMLFPQGFKAIQFFESL